MTTPLPLLLKGLPAAAALAVALSFSALPLLTGCNEVSNNPHPPGSEKTNTIFAPFFERSPKYLDPTSSYSNDETPVTYQVYDCLLYTSDAADE